MSGFTEGIDSRMFKLLSGILSRNGDRKDRSLVRGRSARHPWSLVRMLGRYDAATTTIDNVRHWAAADGLSANAANSPEVRRTLRNRSRYEIANNSYARGISLTLANDCVGTGPRLQMLTADAFANRFVEQEFFAWADAAGLAEKLRTMRLARVSDGESFGLLTSNPRIDSPVQLDLKLVEAEQVTSPLANPNVLPAFEIVFLNGRRTPVIERVEMPANTLGMGFRSYIDFGVNSQDPRAAVKVTGE